MDHKIPVGVSNRHVHLSREHVHQLFGPSYELSFLKKLSQPGQFAAKETVTLATEKGSVERVRILGPVRSQTQVEVSRTDSFRLGISPPVRESGDLDGTPGIRMIGPNGIVDLGEGVIIAHRHVHFHPNDAQAFHVQDGDLIKLRAAGKRSIVFENVLCRVHALYTLDFHIDTDEGNAAGVRTGDFVEMMEIQSRVSMV